MNSLAITRVFMRPIRNYLTQECIPGGCVPPAAVAICCRGGSASVHAGIPPRCGAGDLLWVLSWRPPLGVGLETPLGMGLETPQVWAWKPPQARPLNFPLGCGPGDLQGMLGYPPGYLQGMLGYHLQCMLGYHHSLWTEFLTYASENITLPQTSFEGGKNNCNSGL